MTVDGRQHVFSVLRESTATSIISINMEEGTGVVAAPLAHKLQRQVRTYSEGGTCRCVGACAQLSLSTAQNIWVTFVLCVG